MIKNIFLGICITFLLSCSEDRCNKNEGISFANVNYREWDLGSSFFQFRTFDNLITNEGGCEDNQFLTVYLYRYMDNIDCRLSGQITFDSIPMVFNEKIEILISSYYQLLDDDVFGENYQFNELENFESYLLLKKQDNGCQKITGEFPLLDTLESKK